MRRFKINLVAGQVVPLDAAGDFFRVTAGTAEFEVQPDTGHRLAGLQSGMAFETEKPFKRLFLTSEVNQQVEIMAGPGRVEDNRSSINGKVDTTGGGLTITSTAETVGTVSGELLAQDTARRSVVIKNKSAADSIFIGPAGVSIADGLEIEAGQSFTIDHAAGAAIHAVTETNPADVVCFAELD